MPFIPYQVDHQTQNTAKTLGFSKKRVNFKFGFANQQAIDEDHQGAGCRGSEHEVVFVWSLKSGKRQLFLNGKDVHYSESGQNGWTVDRSWQHTFPLKDTATGAEYRVHFISQPPRPEIPNVHPFDLRINGVSYFKFNEIWKLGTSQMVVRGQTSSGGTTGHGGQRRTTPHQAATSAEEERQIAQAKLESLKDYAKQQEKQQEQAPVATPSPAAATADLFSFDPPPPSQVIVPGPAAAPTGAMAFAQPPAAAGGYGTTPTSAYGQPPVPQQQPYISSNQSVASYTVASAPPQAAAQQQQLTPYAGAPTGYGGIAVPSPAPNGYAAAPPPAMGAPPAYGAAPGGAAPPAYIPQTPSYAGASANPFSPGGQTEYSYGSAPSFARPPAPGQPPVAGVGGYPQQQQQPAYPPAAVGGYPQQPPVQHQPYGGFAQQ